MREKTGIITLLSRYGTRRAPQGYAGAENIIPSSFGNRFGGFLGTR